MEVIFAVLIVTGIIRWVGNTVIDGIHAAKGTVSPRWEAKLAAAKAAGKPSLTPPRYGSRGYFADLWDDVWRDLRTRRDAKRAARAQAGELPLLPLEPMVRAVPRAAAAVVRPVGSRPSPRPRQSQGGPVEETTGPPGPAPADGPVPTCEHCGATLHMPGALHSAGTDICPTTSKPYPDRTRPQPEPSPTPDTEQNGATTVTAPTDTPTGEATNYEQAHAELTKIRAVLASMHSNTTILGHHVEQGNEMVDVLDGQRDALQRSVSTYVESLEGQHVDTETTGHAQQVLDALSPDNVKQLIDQLDQAGGLIKAVVDALDIAQSSVDSAQRSLVEKYGDAADVMATHGTRGAFIES